jgi:hypothetical protein
MKEEDFKNLNTGDIVKHKSINEHIVVTATYGLKQNSKQNKPRRQ